MKLRAAVAELAAMKQWNNKKPEVGPHLDGHDRLTVAVTLLHCFSSGYNSLLLVIQLLREIRYENGEIARLYGT